MAIVCHPRPNRTVPRKWTEKDLARVAKHLGDGGISPWHILGYVAAATGVGVLLCKAAKVLNAFSALARFISRLGILAGLSILVNFLLSVLTKGIFKTLPLVNRIALVIVLVLGVVDRIVKSLQELSRDRAIISEVSDAIERACASADEYIRRAGGAIAETTMHGVDSAMEIWEKEATELKRRIDEAQSKAK